MNLCLKFLSPLRFLLCEVIAFLYADVCSNHATVIDDNAQYCKMFESFLANTIEGDNHVPLDEEVFHSFFPDQLLDFDKWKPQRLQSTENSIAINVEIIKTKIPSLFVLRLHLKDKLTDVKQGNLPAILSNFIFYVDAVIDTYEKQFNRFPCHVIFEVGDKYYGRTCREITKIELFKIGYSEYRLLSSGFYLFEISHGFVDGEPQK